MFGDKSVLGRICLGIDRSWTHMFEDKSVLRTLMFGDTSVSELSCAAINRSSDTYEREYIALGTRRFPNKETSGSRGHICFVLGQSDLGTRLMSRDTSFQGSTNKCVSGYFDLGIHHFEYTSEGHRYLWTISGWYCQQTKTETIFYTLL